VCVRNTRLRNSQVKKFRTPTLFCVFLPVFPTWNFFMEGTKEKIFARHVTGFLRDQFRVRVMFLLRTIASGPSAPPISPHSSVISCLRTHSMPKTMCAKVPLGRLVFVNHENCVFFSLCLIRPSDPFQSIWHRWPGKRSILRSCTAPTHLFTWRNSGRSTTSTLSSVERLWKKFCFVRGCTLCFFCQSRSLSASPGPGRTCFGTWPAATAGQENMNAYVRLGIYRCVTVCPSATRKQPHFPSTPRAPTTFLDWSFKNAVFLRIRRLTANKSRTENRTYVGRMFELRVQKTFWKAGRSCTRRN